MEDAILSRIDLETALAKLHPADRAMMLLIYRVACPDDWDAGWPPRYLDIGRYIGLRFEGSPLSEAAIRYRRDVVLRMWAGKRGHLRRNKGG